MECLIYIANGMNLLGYCMKDILRLRIMMLFAASCLAAYFYCRPEPLMTVVYWNLFYVSLNLFQIIRLLAARLGVFAGDGGDARESAARRGPSRNPTHEIGRKPLPMGDLAGLNHAGLARRPS